jgi:hypothetical protein
MKRLLSGRGDSDDPQNMFSLFSGAKNTEIRVRWMPKSEEKKRRKVVALAQHSVGMVGILVVDIESRDAMPLCYNIHGFYAPIFRHLSALAIRLYVQYWTTSTNALHHPAAPTTRGSELSLTRPLTPQSEARIRFPRLFFSLAPVSASRPRICMIVDNFGLKKCLAHLCACKHSFPPSPNYAK